ncbi:hypothetical protein JXA56_02040 [Candidatus Micrarchaeota archaeon]|nr:hypothetical protein [Candidatus Micrarchaeota archaeon]
MAKSRILKKENKAYLELPKELMEYDEVELFQLKEGYLLVPVEVRVKEAEIAVIRKLLAIKFENRTPSVIEKEFVDVEKILLRELEKKGLVNIFRGKKYPKGVYNINAEVYALLQESKKIENPEGLVRGFVTLKDKDDAYRLSQKLGSEMKNGTVIGVKGFDGKFYAVTKSYLESSRKDIEKALQGEMDAGEIANAAKLDPEGCIAVLRLMAESGDILEKKKGIFVRV